MILARKEHMDYLDQKTIERYHIPGEILMEHAAMACVDTVEADRYRQVIVIAGPGNNGGDGYAIARLLKIRGYDVSVYRVGDEPMEDTPSGIMYRSSTRLVQSQPFDKEKLMDIEYKDLLIIDALLGTGVKRELKTTYLEVVDWINAGHNAGARVMAVDLPSGIGCDDGHLYGVAVEADYTVTFTLPKVAHFAPHSRYYCGEVIVKPIGIVPELMEDLNFTEEVLTEDLMNRLMHKSIKSHKLTYGRILIVAGNPDMGGAAVLATKSCLRAGGGFVEVLTSKLHQATFLGEVTEAVVHTYEDMGLGVEQLKTLMKDKNYGTILIGPGLGLSREAKEMTDYVLANHGGALIIDGDALTHFASYKQQVCSDRIVLTPHIGEMGRLMDVDHLEIASDPIGALKAYYEGCGFQGIVVLKSDTTVISNAKKEMIMNPYGHVGMAKAGSGDALAGIIAGLTTYNEPLILGVALSVLVHSLAAKKAANTKGIYGMTTTDLIDQIGQVIG